MKKIAIVLLAIATSTGCQNKKLSPEASYIDKQFALIEAHKKFLVTAGRITDPDNFVAEMYLASYGWRLACDIASDQGSWCTEGASSGGYYTSFSAAAFEQAKNLYVIHGVMFAGTDILIDASYGECIEEPTGGCVLNSSSGYASPRKPGAFDKDVVGHSVGALTYCLKYGVHYEHCDWGKADAFIDSSKVVKFIDGGHVRLDHKAKYDAEMYGLILKPPDYVDMCGCTIPTIVTQTVTERGDSKPKACVQGGWLLPGESCTTSLSVH